MFKEAPLSDIYPPEGGFVNTNLVQDEESQEFDDLIFALKTGMISSLVSHATLLYFTFRIKYDIRVFAPAVLLVCQCTPVSK